MALSASTVWEVRPGAGSDTACGGGFVTGASGTDYSQQNAAQYSLTLLTTAAANAIILTSTAAAVMVGNIIQITGGTNFTAGFYQIISVSVGVSITVDRNCTTAAGSAGVGYIGGALASILAVSTPAIGGNIVYMKGTYTTTATQLFAGVFNGAAGPLTFIGYSVTRGDGAQATWTTATNSTDLINFVATIGYVFQNFKFTCTAGTPGNGLTGGVTGSNVGALSLINCLIQGFAAGMDGDYNVYYAFANLYLENCVIQNCTSHGIINAGSVQTFDCLIQNNGGDGCRFNTGNSAVQGSWVLTRCIVYNNAGKGLNNLRTDPSTAVQGQFVLSNCDIVGNGSDGIGAANIPALCAENVIVALNGGWGINYPSTPLGGVVNKLFFYSNASGNRNNFQLGSATDTILTANPFVAPGTGNFALNGASGGGVACQAAGFPGVLQAGGTGYIDAGALQHPSVASTYVISPHVTRYSGSRPQ